MANVFVTPSIIAKATLMHLENSLVLGNMVWGDFSQEFTKVGETISVRRPNRFTVQEDNLDVTGAFQDILEGLTDISMNKTGTVPFEIDPKDKVLKVEQVQERYVEPAVTVLKDKIEKEIGALYTSVYHTSGTAGSAVDSFRKLATPATLMDYAGIPSNRVAVHNPMTALDLADSLKGVYVSEKARTAFQEAKIGRYARFDNYESIHIPDHVVGNYGGTPLVNGAGQGSLYASVRNTWEQTLVTDGWSASEANLLTAGDTFTIDGVYMVNPIDPSSTRSPFLQSFVVKSVTASDGGGNATVTISPPIIPADAATAPEKAYATVNTLPADNAAITVTTGAANGQYKQSLLFHKNAFALVTRPLEIDPDSFKTSTVSGNRMSISVSTNTDFNTLKKQYRLDQLFGVKAIDPRCAVRLIGQAS